MHRLARQAGALGGAGDDSVGGLEVLEQVGLLEALEDPIFGLVVRQRQKLAGGFLRESNNEVRDIKALDNAVENLRALGFLKSLPGDSDRFEVRRIIKARFGAGELETVKEKLARHAGGI